MPSPTSLIDALESTAARRPDRVAVRYLANGDQVTTELTYAELTARCRAASSELVVRATPGDRVLIMCPPGPEYVIAFLACLYAGVVAVPIYPPSPVSPGRALARLRSVVTDSGATVALTVAGLRRHARALPEDVVGRLRWLAVEEIARDGDSSFDPRPVDPGQLAFLQYTSGSTADPKGVMVPHGAMVANLRLVDTVYGVGDGGMVSWLPPFHDMGLVGGILTPLWLGGTTTLMPPEAFLRRPRRWLQAISTYGAVISPAPNFAFDYCVRQVSDAELAGLDLSSWRIAINGAEPVRPRTLRAFADKFAGCGFSASFQWPSYGMAETVVLASAAPFDPASGVLDVDAEALSRGAVRPATTGAGRSVELVSCGTVPPGTAILAVDPERRLACRPGEVGELWVGGPHVAAGYWARSPEDNRSTFAARLADGSPGAYLRTGDLGAVVDGRVVVTGRTKDVMIVRGVNHYPQDFEQAMERAHDKLRPDCGVAFSVPTNGDEQVVLVQGTKIPADDAATLCEAANAIVERVTEATGVRPGEVLLVAPRDVARTTSGKVRRSATRAAYLAGELTALHQWRAGAPAGAGPS